jgi:hypothetical protein
MAACLVIWVRSGLLKSYGAVSHVISVGHKGCLIVFVSPGLNVMESVLSDINKIRHNIAVHGRDVSRWDRLPLWSIPR